MLTTLEALGPEGFAEQYELGIRTWQDEAAMQKLDRWMEEHDSENSRWLWRLAQEQQAAVLQTVA